MRRNIPVILLKLLETWFELGVTYVKWGSFFWFCQAKLWN